MSKNQYLLPFKGSWYVEYGGTKKKNSHSWNIVGQRYAYDFEIRKDDSPYHSDPTKIANYYSYLENVFAPADGWVIDIVDEYENTHITKDRKIINDCNNPRGNHIIIKHKHGEYSTICHFEKHSFCVEVGDLVKAGQMIGKVGNSGNTQGPHIHFQIQKGIDPDNSFGIPIKFKNAYCNNKRIRKIEKGMEIESR